MSPLDAPDTISGSLLPASLKVLGEEILAGPMRLVIETTDGVIDTARADTPRITADAAGLKAEIAGRTAGSNRETSGPIAGFGSGCTG